jgi:hypothetical protein
MDKIKKIYVDSRYRASNSISNSDFKFELKEQIDVPDNTFLYIDDISIPHSWYSLEEYNNRLYIQYESSQMAGFEYIVVILPTGNYTGLTFASTLQVEVQKKIPNMFFVYNNARGTITITTSTGDKNFRILTDNHFIPGYWSQIFFEYADEDWKDVNDNPVSVDANNLMSLNEVIRNEELQPNGNYEFETGFLDLITTHNIYLHCPNLGHYTCVGVRGETSIVKKIPVSSSFGYLILDSVVAPHDKIDVSRQSLKTMHFTLKDVHGNNINLHGANCSFSLVLQTIE